MPHCSEPQHIFNMKPDLVPDQVADLVVDQVLEPVSDPVPESDADLVRQPVLVLDLVLDPV
jgi:hypothetical protein